MRELTERQQKVLAYIEAHPYCTITNIESDLRIDYGGAKWGLEGLVKRRLVERFERWSEHFGGRVVYSYVALGEYARP